jgi:rhodanese-related sulfurtransferase
MLDLNPTAAFAMRDAARIIDVREPDEFTGELGHIPGAELVPLTTVERTASTWDKNAALIVVCRSGARSGRAAQALIRAGFRRVMNLSGGMVAYRAAGLPVVHG